MVGRIIFIGSALYYLYLKFMLDSFGKLAVMPFWAFLADELVGEFWAAIFFQAKLCSKSILPGVNFINILYVRAFFI